MDDAITQFRDAMRAAGLEPLDVIEAGKLHRFPGAGKRPANRAGWCRLFEDGLGGCFGDWSTGHSETWQAKRDKSFSRAERAAFACQVEEAKRQVEAERHSRQAEAAKRAAAIWNAATPAPPNHPYLLRKRIQPHGARIHNGALTLPVIDFTGKLTSLQFIASNGDKRLLSGGRKRGCCIPVAGDEEHARRILICEGWATGATLARLEPTALVLAAIDAGNLEPVAVGARRQWPAAEIIVCADSDPVGIAKARRAAIAAGALMAVPQFPDGADGSDFNDLANLAGGAA